MGGIDFVLERLAAQGENPALFWRGQTYRADSVLRQVQHNVNFLGAKGVGPGSVVLLRGDYSPATVSFFLALVRQKVILAPLLPSTLAKNSQLFDIVDPQFEVDLASPDEITFRQRSHSKPHPLIRSLQASGNPGLILFTSGSAGEPKAVVHDFERLLEKFRVTRPALRTLNFLFFDHWGGLNTLLHCLSTGSSVVLPESRTPDSICSLLEQHRVELLPASPTFLNMLLLSKTYEERDLSALRLITYGSEPMPVPTLAALRVAFPNVELRQTYGLIELGVLRAKSLSTDSLWMKVGGEGYDLRIVDGILQIKTKSAMLGYLNAPSPFTDDGYFVTGDRVELNGEYLKILGRDSELINVAGQKVFPAEVETTLLECPLVEDAVVYGERHPITGRIVCADIQLRSVQDQVEARRIIRMFCAERLDPFKVPVKIQFANGGIHSDRLKRLRVGRETFAAE